MSTRYILNRLDYGIKRSYARQYSTYGKVSNFTNSLYLSHLRGWNSFIEDNKSNADDFLKNYKGLLDHCKYCSENHIDHKLPPISVTSDERLVNGIHRYAATSHHNLKIRKELVTSPHKYNTEFFRTYINPHDGSTFSEGTIKDMIGEYIKELELNAIFILPKAIEIDGGKYAKEQLLKNNEYCFLKRFKVPTKLMSLLVAHFYHDQLWCNNKNGFNRKSIRHKAQEITSISSLQYIDVYVTDDRIEKRALLKERIRNYYRMENSSVHSTDCHLDARKVLKFMETSDKIVNIWDDTKSWDSKVVNSFFSNQTLFKDNEYCNDLMVVGSSVLDISGLRSANDIDFIARNKKLIPNVQTHNRYYYLYEQPIFDLLDDRESYFNLFGVRVMDGKYIIKFKDKRNEKKDKLDIQLLNSIGII